MNDPEVNLNILKIPWVNSRSLRDHYEVKSGLIQNAPIELKFDMSDPEVNLNLLKIRRVNSRSLRSHYEVNSSLIQNAPIELIFGMNNPFVILHMLNYSRGHSRSKRAMMSLLVLQCILSCHQKANVNIRCACIPVSACRHRAVVLSFFCQPYNLMYLWAAMIDFNETWSQWSTTQPVYIIWPLKVKGEGKMSIFSHIYLSIEINFLPNKTRLKLTLTWLALFTHWLFPCLPG